MKLTVLLAAAAIACAATQPSLSHSASIRIGLDNEVPGTLIVSVGDSLIHAAPGEVSRCVTWDALQRPVDIRIAVVLDSAFLHWSAGDTLGTSISWPNRAGWQNTLLALYRNDFNELIAQLHVVNGQCSTTGGLTPDE